jgi:hypothetical protein
MSTVYRDAQLSAQLKELRAAVKPFAQARAALERVEERLRYVLRMVETWDTSHAERCETLIRLGNLAAANTAASLVFEPGLRTDLLRRCFVGIDHEADDRIAEAIELGREVLA